MSSCGHHTKNCKCTSDTTDMLLCVFISTTCRKNMIAEIQPENYMHLQTEIWEYHLIWKYSVMAQDLDCNENG